MAAEPQAVVGTHRPIEYWVVVKCTTVEQQQALAAELRAQGRTVKVHVGGNP
jgi:hypothetical protein